MTDIPDDVLPVADEDTPDGPDDAQADPHVDDAAEILERDDAPLVGAPPEFAGARPGEAREDELA